MKDSVGDSTAQVIVEVNPITKLSHLVKDMKTKSLEEIYLFSLLIKES